MKAKMVLAAVVFTFGAACAYDLVDGVLTVNVPAGEVQTDLTSDQLNALGDADCTELNKTGDGELIFASSPLPNQSGFKGTIRVSNGILTMNFGRWGGLLGTTDGPTIVEPGATLKTMNYHIWYDHEPLTISGTGYNNHGAIWHTGTAGATTFGKVTLAGNATIINDSTSKAFNIRNDVLDMGGYDLTISGPNGAGINVDPTEIQNAGNLHFIGIEWGIPCTARLDQGPSHKILLEYTGTKPKGAHTNYCNWTLKIVNPNCTLRAYDPPFIWDGPIELPDSGTFTLQPESATGRNPPISPENYYIRLNGPISGGSKVSILTANVNGAENGSMVILAGTNTYTGGTVLSGNAKGPLVCMVPEAVPGLLDAINAGQFPASSVYSVSTYVHVLAAGAQTE